MNTFRLLGALGIRRRASVRTASQVSADLGVWVIGTYVAALARYDFDAIGARWTQVSLAAVCFAIAQILVGMLLDLYSGRYQSASMDELRVVASSSAAVALAGTVVVVIAQPAGVARSLPFLAWALAFLGMTGVRVVKRLIVQAHSRPGQAAERVLVLGAGWVGSALTLRMVRDPLSPYLPVGFLDDDPTKRNLQLHGVRVHGRFDDLPQVAALLDVTHVIVAINMADAVLLRRVSDLAAGVGVRVLVMPALKDAFRGPQLRLSSLREIDVEDVIGRRPVDTNVASIAEYVTGRRVLVTGAGGSIGSELCRQLHTFGPSELVLLDRDESALHAVELSIYGRALLESPQTVLVDIRDREAVDTVFSEHQPQVVFHAAALKHLTLLERYPYEALKTNVYGTLNILEAAAANGVEHFVNISTDKAANPKSALGHSKRLAEQLTASFASRAADAKFLSVRFGNVLGSRGSVLHAFAAQIEGGGPVTITDPEVSRFFMTIPEACQLVIQAGAIGRGGEALVLDMGKPVKIVDLAQRMIALSGKQVDIVFTGLREGEKLHEDLLSTGETDDRPMHPLISHVPVPPLDGVEIEGAPWPREIRTRFGHRGLTTAHQGSER